MADADQSFRKKRNRRAGLPSDVKENRRGGDDRDRDRDRGDRERTGNRDQGRDREKPRGRDAGDGDKSDREGHTRARSRREGGDFSRPRQRKQETTANMVKKRYSVRYNQAPDESEAPPMPGLPKAAQKYAREDASDTSRPGSRSGPDTQALYDPNLNPDKYIGNFLSNATETDITDFQRKLKKMGGRAQADLSKSVYHNRNTFISISKEADKLKAEMQMLRGLMADLTTTLGQASSTSGASDAYDDSSRKRANRSSLANLEAMYNTQLQALWKNIEGSQKFLAAVPGRHVVHESGHWAELDGATLKARRNVHVVLLNDNLLIAARKAKRLDTNDPSSRRPHTKLVAVRCWPLQEIDMVVVKAPSRDAEDALAVRHGQESYTFSGDRGNPKDQAELLQAFRRSKDELRRTERDAQGGPGDLRGKETSDYLAARDPAVSRQPGLLGTLSKTKDRPEVLIDVDGKQRNLRWVEGQIDELDIEVALQRFDEAVTHVEKLRKLARGLKGSPVAQEIITVKIDERATKLAEILTQRLVAHHAWISSMQGTVAYLNRLGCAAQARRAYLGARSATIAARARACVFAGDVLAHVTDLAYVYFTLIKNTVSIYQSCFPREMGGAVVVWAKAELDRFNEALGRALGGVDPNGDQHREALARARDLAGSLGEVGIDFVGLVGEEAA